MAERGPFFVLSAERSGTLTFAESLDQAPDCACRHIAYPQLVEESVGFACGETSLEDVVARLDDRLPAGDRMAYGEANPRFALIVPPLLEAYPDARFVWLLRDARSYTCSGLQLGWYEHDEPPDDDEWERGRLRADRLGEMTPEEWSGLSRLERIAWSWVATNRMIEQGLSALPEERVVTVRIEQLESELPQLCSFLGIERVARLRGRANSRRLPDEPNHESPDNVVEAMLSWHDWDDGERAAFGRVAGEAMDRLYPDWRGGDGGWRDTREEYPWVPISELLPPLGDEESRGPGEPGREDVATPATGNLAARVEALEQALSEERERRERALTEISRRSAELAESRSELEAIRRSRSFRWGHGVALAVWQVRRAARRLRRRSGR